MAELEQVSDTQAEETAKEPFNLKKELWEWAKAIFFAAVIVFIVFNFIIQVVTVKGSSMAPTLENQDRLVISDLFYTPETGDIGVLSVKSGLGEASIKRIVALPGQTVDINENGEVLVDGKVLSEPYIAELIDEDHYGDMDYPVTVPEGTVFVMGDNRNHSTDSRFSEVGFVDEDEILGRVIFRLLPLDKIGTVH